MVTSNEFDMVFDCQQIFKNVMNALARPGKIFSVTGSVQKITGDHAEMSRTDRNRSVSSHTQQEPDRKMSGACRNIWT